MTGSALHTAVLLTGAMVLAACAGARTTEGPVTFRDTGRDGFQGPEMVWIPAGRFRMGDLHGDGDYDEKPVHDVEIARTFAMSRREITVAEFREFVTATAYVTEAERDGGCMVQGGKSWHEPKYSQTGDHPVVCVSWNDANAYVRWLAAQTGKAYRLPTEAEWEYAARGGTATRYSWGDDFVPGRANCWGCLPPEMFHWTVPVGSFPPNAFGLFDLEGNVWELTSSEWSGRYEGLDLAPSTHDERGGTRAIRGGGWFNGPPDIRPANRGGVPPTDRYNTMGIRVVRD
jgi:formylglycine-generating enzyme required for sulfatase activity